MKKWSRFSGYHVSGYRPEKTDGKRQTVSDAANDRDPSLGSDYAFDDAWNSYAPEEDAPIGGGENFGDGEEAAPSSPVRRSGRSRGKKIPWLGLGAGAAAVVFLVSSIALIRYFSEAARSNTASEQLRSAYHSLTPAPLAETFMPGQVQAGSGVVASVTIPPAKVVATAQPNRTRRAYYPSNPTLSVMSTFTNLRRINPDVVGWLSFPGLVDEAVVLRDNVFYLNHDHNGSSNINGAIFADERMTITTPPENWLLYGHNMRTGAMFGRVTRYRTDGIGFMTAHALGSFNTVYEDGRYIIFAVTVANTRSSAPDYLPFMRALTFSTDEEFTKYIERVRTLSLYDIPVDVAPGDELLTFCTCINGLDDYRLLVLFRRVREGENENQLQQAVNQSTIRLQYQRSAGQ